MTAAAALAGESWRGLDSLLGTTSTAGNDTPMDEPDTVSAEDASDIEAARKGDEEAFARVVRRYQPLVYRQMFRFTRDRVVLDELVHEAFVEAYFSLKGFRGTAPFLHWLRRIATRVGYRHWKRADRQRRIQDAAHNRAYIALPQGPHAPSDDGDVVFAYLQQLAPPDRLVLTLMYLEECDNDEIAERTGWRPTLGRVRAHRDRKRLKRILEDGGIEL